MLWAQVDQPLIETSLGLVYASTSTDAAVISNVHANVELSGVELPSLSSYSCLCLRGREGSDGGGNPRPQFQHARLLTLARTPVARTQRRSGAFALLIGLSEAGF